MKRDLVLLVCGILLTAVTGAAQVVLNQTTGGAIALRQEGLKEKISTVTLTVQQAGDCKVAGSTCTLAKGATVLLTFNANIANAASVSTANAACSSDLALCTNLTVTAAGNVVTLFYTAATTVAAGETITLGLTQGPPIVPAPLRVDATTVVGGPGSLVTVLPSSPTPVDVTIGVTNQNVGQVSAVLALTVGLSPTPGLMAPLPGPVSILTCVPPTSGAPGTFVLNLKENFPNALSSGSDEGIGATQGSNIEIDISNVPPTATITPTAVSYCPNFPTTPGLCGLSVTLPAGLTNGSTQGSLAFTITVNTTNPGQIEDMDITFTISTSAATLPTGELTPGVAMAKLVPTTPATDTPLFTGVPEGHGATVFNLSDCITELLLPWVSNFQKPGDGSTSHYDTGIVIANTTSDPFTSGSAVHENGSCSLIMYADDGTVNPNPLAPVVNSGASWVFAASSQWPGKSGYVIGFCNFQNAHAFVYIVDNAGLGAPKTASGYLGLVIPTTTLVSRNPAGIPGCGPSFSNDEGESFRAAPCGTGESLGN